MNIQQAKAHNDKITEQIKKLQNEYMVRLRIRIIERSGDHRENIEDKETDYMKQSQADVLYKDYRALYPNTKTHFILVEPIEDVKRVVRVTLPTRDDSERDPPVGVATPDIDPFAEV